MILARRWIQLLLFHIFKFFYLFSQEHTAYQSQSEKHCQTLTLHPHCIVLSLKGEFTKIMLPSSDYLNYFMYLRMCVRFFVIFSCNFLFDIAKNAV